MKIRQGPNPPADFHTIPKQFTQNIYNVVNIYDSISMILNLEIVHFVNFH